MTPLHDNTIVGKSKGAYTNILIFTNSCDQYISRVMDFLHNNKLKLIEIEDVEPFLERVKKRKLKRDLHVLAKRAKDENIPQYSTLHLFYE